MQTCGGIGFTDSDLYTAGDGLRCARCLCVCNHVGELSKHFPIDSFLSNEICYNLNSELERQ